MNIPMIITLIILAGAAICFMIGKIRSDLVAMCALILLVLFNILTPGEALSGFSNSVVIMMIGLFIVGGGIFQTGLAKIASGKLLKLAGTNELTLLIMVMVVTSALGGFVSNTGTVAVMLPIVVSLAMSANVSPSLLLMPLAFSSSLGAMFTLIGTPPNLIIQDTLIAAGEQELSFFSFAPIGAVCLTLGLLFMIVMRKQLTRNKDADKSKESKSRSVQELAKQYQLAENLYRVHVGADSSIVNKSLHELNIPSRYQLNIVEIRRKSSHKNPFFKTMNQQVAARDSVIQAGDILYLLGEFDRIQPFVSDYQLSLMDERTTERQSGGQPESKLTFQEVGIAEVLLTPQSRFINQLVKHTAFREKYRVNILGIHRKGEYLLHNLKNEKLRFGDALLVQGSWGDIALLSEEQDDVVVVGQPLKQAEKVTLDHKAPIAAGIMILMVVMLILEVLPAVITVLLAAIFMIITGCLRNMEAAYKTINWESIVLIGAMIPMSIAIENTGAAAMLSEGLVQSLGGFGPVALLAGVYFATSLLTLFISNTASAVLFAPIAYAAAIQMEASPYPFLFAVAVAASMCFATPFSTPPNALVMTPGRYTFMDYIKIGLPLQLLIGLAMIFVLPLLYPF
ncbi:SLC13 family permease [Paenibacillus senegalensis]|uniref:SLC13 family permease n=1 Tax=Paenibacillus senegalensis TaxID=1465766 RepID=UPI001B30A7DE